MKHFLKVGEVNVTPLMNALMVNADLWDQNTLRTTHPGTPHGAVSDIWVRFNDLNQSAESALDDHETIPYPAWWRLPQIRPILFDLMRLVEATRVGRMVITKLPPGKAITPHVDAGAPATYYTRYQIALQSLPGAIFQIEDEKVNFRTGEVWLINNRGMHGVVNNSTDDRIVLIADLRVERNDDA